MFVKGDDDLNFAYVADVIDIGRGRPTWITSD